MGQKRVLDVKGLGAWTVDEDLYVWRRIGEGPEEVQFLEGLRWFREVERTYLANSTILFILHDCMMSS